MSPVQSPESRFYTYPQIVRWLYLSGVAPLIDGSVVNNISAHCVFLYEHAEWITPANLNEVEF